MAEEANKKKDGRSPDSFDSSGTSKFEETLDKLKQEGCDDEDLYDVVEAFATLNQNVGLTFLEFAVSEEDLKEQGLFPANNRRDIGEK